MLPPTFLIRLNNALPGRTTEGEVYTCSRYRCTQRVGHAVLHQIRPLVLRQRHKDRPALLYTTAQVLAANMPPVLPWKCMDHSVGDS